MKEYKCPNCGASIDPIRGICPYCKSKFKLEDDDIIRVECYHNPIRTFTTSIEASKKYANDENYSKYLIDCLASNLSKAIAGNMDLQTSYDPVHMSTKITARIRIVEPNYLF